MKRVHIWTKFWADTKIAKCHWLEKFMMLHLLTHDEMTTMGFVQVNLARVAGIMNADPPCKLEGLPALEPEQLQQALSSLRRRRIILLAGRSPSQIYFNNYLKHAQWSPTVVRGWPKRIRAVNTPPAMERKMREACLDFCGRRKIAIPRGLAPRKS